jgi:GATA-binding protein
MAESLRSLNQAHEHHRPRTETLSQDQQSTPGREDQRPEIYHSLEDAIPISDESTIQATSTALQIPHINFDGTNAPISGQVCRYVI